MLTFSGKAKRRNIFLSLNYIVILCFDLSLHILSPEELKFTNN